VATVLIIVAFGAHQLWDRPESITISSTAQIKGPTDSIPVVQTARPAPVEREAQPDDGKASADTSMASADLQSTKDRVEQHLKEQETHEVAEKSGLAQILAQKKQLREVNRISAKAEQYLAEGNFTEAEKTIADGLALYPGHAKLQRLESRTAKLRNTMESSVQELASKASQRLDNNDLTTPLGDSAFYYYSEIEKLDPGNTIAREGFKNIVNRYALLADNAYRKLDYRDAEHYVNKGLEIDPNHFRLQALQRDLAESGPEKALRSFKKNINAWLSD
jgi:tetratricopeptide (TPR) repeat protein